MNIQLEKRLKKQVNLSGFSKQQSRYVSLHATLNNLLENLVSLYDRLEKIAILDQWDEEWNEFPHLNSLIYGKMINEIESVLFNVKITM
jgi:hypothetical protein